MKSKFETIPIYIQADKGRKNTFEFEILYETKPFYEGQREAKYSK